MTTQVIAMAVIAVIVSALRFCGVKGAIYKSLAHVYVGAVFALGFLEHNARTTDEHGNKSFYAGMFIVLCVVELTAVAIEKLRKPGSHAVGAGG